MTMGSTNSRNTFKAVSILGRQPYGLEIKESLPYLKSAGSFYIGIICIHLSREIHVFQFRGISYGSRTNKE
jgi:hypothetical protein